MAEPIPSACRWCGVERHEHFRRWNAEPGWHGYTAPTQEQIKARMLARREERLASPPPPVIEGDLTGLYIPPGPPCIPDHGVPVWCPGCDSDDAAPDPG